MKSSPNQRAGLRQGSLSAFSVLIGLAALLSCLAPRASVPMLALLALVDLPPLLAGWRSGGARFWSALATPIVVSGLVLLAYLALNSFWALDPAAAIKKVMTVALIGGGLALVIHAVAGLNSDQLNLGATLLAGAVALGALFLAIELATGQFLARLSYNLLPILRPDSTKDLITAGDRVVGIAPYELNRNFALLVMSLWSALLVLLHHPKIRRRRLLTGVLFTLVAVASLFSEHESSVIAIAVSCAVYLLSVGRSRTVQRGLIAVWCLGFVMAIPLGLFFYYGASLHKAPWLPSTAQARIIIWGYTAEKIPENPLLGVGLRSTRVLDQERAPVAERPEGHVFARRTGRHAHNIFLQSWYELGLVGAALVMAFGVAVFSRIALLPAALQPFGHAVSAGAIVYASLAWGTWQTWLLAGYALSVVYLLLAVRFAGQELDIVDPRS